MVIGRGAVAVVLGLLLAGCTKEPGRPVTEASADAEVDAMAMADADAMADASADADADADLGAGVDAALAQRPMSGDGGADGGSVTSARKDVTLDETGDGKTIELAKGQSVVLMLPANPSSGFDWAVIHAPPALGTPTMGFVAGGTQMGAGGKRRIAFTVKDALPPGEHGVELGYARSFEKGVAPFKTFRFKVRAPR